MPASDMKPMQHNFISFLKRLSFIMALGVLLFAGEVAKAQFPYSQTFRNSTASDVLLGGNGTHASLTGGSVDAEGEGYLRLTSNARTQSGFARSTTPFSSDKGFSISFEYYTYGGNGDADGISFFLYDATATPFNIGDTGGSLGYAPNGSIPGVSKAYIGFGFDEFGNFSSTHLDGPGQLPNSITLRGDGNGILNPGVSYKYLTGVQTTNALLMSSIGAGSAFTIAGGVNGRDKGADGLKPSHAGYRKALIKMDPNSSGTGFIINVWITEGTVDGGIMHHVVKDYAYTGSTLPQNLSYGFAGSTGDYTNYHEIRNLTIDLPEELNSIVVANVNIDGNENEDITFNSSEFTSKFSSLKNTALTKIKIADLPANGQLRLNGINVVAGQEILASDISYLVFRPDAGFAGTATFSWNGTEGTIYSDNTALVNLKIKAIPSKFPYSESFTKSLAKGMVYGGTPAAASLTGGGIDAEGNGYLRLTSNAKNQLGFARSTAAFPSENGFSISFDYFSYGGNGADGISFFLFDATASPFNIGEPGGSLGYSGGSSLPGVSKAYIGFGLDEFGNFSSSFLGGPGQFPSSVTIRGNGDGHMGIAGNYRYLTGIQTTDQAAMSASGSGTAFNVSGGFDGRSGLTPLSEGYRNAKIEMVPNGSGTGYIINVWITEGAAAGEIKHHVIKNYSYTGNTPPQNLSFGFAASSGDYTNYHEIRNMTMVVPPSVILNSSVTEIKKSTLEDVTMPFELKDFTDNFYDPYAFNTLTKVMFTALPAVNQGVIKLDGININANQEISIADISASKLTFVPAPNYNGTTTDIKWTGFNGLVSAPVSGDVTIEIISVNDEPSGNDKTLTLALNTQHIISSTDFGFTDASDIVPNSFKSVVITSLPASGSLKLNNVSLTAGTEISLSSINSNSLIYTPAVDGKGSPYATFKFRLRDNGGVLNGGTDLDQSDNTITINVVDLPSITLSNAQATICIKNPSANILYNSVGGSILPNLYSIDWDAAANQAGISDVSDASLTGGIIPLNNLSNIPAGTYSGILTVRNNTSSFISNGKAVSLVISPALTASISYGANSFCATGTGKVTQSGSTGGVFSSTNGLAINSSTGEINLDKSNPGTYTVTYTLNNQSCSVSATSSVTIKPLPVVPAINGATELTVGTTIQLSNTMAGGTWESYNTEYATINAKGVLKGIKPGIANILYIVKSGNCSSFAIVKIVVNPIKKPIREEEVKSSDAQLASLVLSMGNLSPVFDSNTFSYFTSVEHGVSSISIKPGYDINTTVKVNGTAINEENLTKIVDLSVGSNNITIEVTAADGKTTQVYTLSVDRSAASYFESFRNPTASGLVFGGSPNSARLTAGNTDAAGSGYLRLTSNQKENLGFARSTTSFPGNKGYSISFEYLMYGGSGGEGMTFFLYDAAANEAFNIGAGAGSLGYSQRSDINAPGLSKGFLGLALDDAGNFSNPFQGKQGGPGIRNSAVVLRGDGNGTGAGAPAGSNYEYLTGAQTANPMAMAGLGKPFQLAGGKEGRTAPGGSLDSKESGYRKVRMDMEPNASGIGFKINVYITENTEGVLTTHHLIKNFAYIPTNGIPANLSYGFSASTGATNNFHEVRNLEISPLGSTAVPEINVSEDKPVVIPPVVTAEPETVLPNATNLISPNGDGINDKWIIRNLEKFPNNVVRIFDRSGRMVYMTKNYSNDWEGTFNGNVLEMGTYYYVADFGQDAKTIKGYISIVK